MMEGKMTNTVSACEHALTREDLRFALAEKIAGLGSLVLRLAHAALPASAHGVRFNVYDPER
jgi:hypothetical protein